MYVLDEVYGEDERGLRPTEDRRKLVTVTLTISISCRESVKPVQEPFSFLESKQSPLSWLQKPSEQATSEPSGELMSEEEPESVSQQPPLFPDE